MNNLDVAVVIPCYDLGRTLGEAIESVEAQTVAPAEVIVVDDGSRDPYTRHVLARLADRVTLLSTENRGPAAARNLGIQSARSPVLLLLDADDALEPTYIEKATDLLERRPDLSFVSCALQAFGNASYRWKPPPYSPAEAIARGACGHISTVFRREVWERVGGFDPSLPAYEDVDFWLSALELGFEGEILDEVLVRYRVREGSRYHRGISSDTYRRSKAAILDRHAGSVDLYDEDVFVSLIDFQREISIHTRSLYAKRAQLEEELATVTDEVEEAKARLEELGGTPFEWGDLQGRARSADDSPAYLDTPSDFYRHAFLEDHPDATGPIAVTVRRGESWPVFEDGSVRTLVVLEAFEQEDDLHDALERCREALAPGGALLATFSAIPSRTNGDLRYFTEASVRTLLAEHFPSAAIDVTVYGNLQACVAEVAGLAWDLLRQEELRQADPWHPVLIAARCQVAGTGPRPTVARRRSSHGTRPLSRYAARDRGIILAFHRVADLLPDVHGNCVSPDVFRALMETLSERFTPVPLAEMVSGARDRDLPPRAVAVTFDDGYLDNLLVASPILSDLSIPATFFLTTEGIDEKREAWWDTVERLICTDEVPERLRISVDAGNFDLPTASPDERLRALFILHGALLEAGVAARDELLSALLAWSGRQLRVRETHRLMTSEEVRALSEQPGHEVGVHTVHHPMLPAHPPGVQRQELSESREVLERIIGRPVRALAYPYGACDLSTTETAESVGFTVAVSVTDDMVTPDADSLRLPRLEVTMQDQVTLGSKLDQLFERPWWR